LDLFARIVKSYWRFEGYQCSTSSVRYVKKPSWTSWPWRTV